MDANALSDVQCESGRLRRVGLAPQWQVLTPGSKSRGDGDTKVGLTGAHTIYAAKTIAQGMPMFRLHLR